MVTKNTNFSKKNWEELEKEWIQDNEDEGGSGSDSGSGSGSRSLCRLHSHQLQNMLAEFESKFGDINWTVRATEPPPEADNENTYSAGQSYGMGAGYGEGGGGGDLPPHEFLDSQQFDGVPPESHVKPSLEDLMAAANDPELQLTLNPELRLALQNALNHKNSPTPKPAGVL